MFDAQNGVWIEMWEWDRGGMAQILFGLVHLQRRNKPHIEAISHA